MKTKILFLTMFLFSIQVWAIEYDTTLVLDQNFTININSLKHTQFGVGAESTINNVKVKDGAVLTVQLNPEDDISLDGIRNMKWVGKSRNLHFPI